MDKPIEINLDIPRLDPTSRGFFLKTEIPFHIISKEFPRGELRMVTRTVFLLREDMSKYIGGEFKAVFTGEFSTCLSEPAHFRQASASEHTEN